MVIQGLEKLQSASPVDEPATGPESPPVGPKPESSGPIPSTDSVKNFLTRFLSDPLAGIFRRAEFFAPRESLAKDGASDLNAVPLQNCTGLSVNPTSLYFPDTRVGYSSNLYFTISNPNCCPMNYSLTVPSGFSVSSAGGTVPANGSVSIAVTFTPTYVQNYNGYINISPQGSVSVNGRGISNRD